LIYIFLNFILQLELFSSWDFLVEAKAKANAEANGGVEQYPKWEQVEVRITF